MNQYSQHSETDPLLPSDRPSKKPFYRPRLLWIVPVGMIASLVRGMTLAPRVQVYTQLSCNALYRGQQYSPSANALPSNPSSSYIYVPDHVVPVHTPVYFPQSSHSSQEHHHAEGPRQFVSKDCLSDPAVQAGAARLQTTIATITSLLAACSTTLWGHYGQKHGRTRVLTASTLGLLTTDLAFAFASTPSSPLSRHGHKLLLFSSFVEGILGSQATIHAAISAYVSDCTSDGSRAHIFSRFLGGNYVGFALGPVLGAFLIRHPLLQIQSLSHGKHHRAMHSVTAAFGAAVLFSAINLLLILIIPESLDKAKRLAAQKVDDPDPATQNESSLKERLLIPLAVFAPQKTTVNGRMRKDWSMSWLATAIFLLYLAGGVFPIKYLYAEHVFGWDAEQLGYYISFVGAVRALHTLLLMPFLISTFKPSLPPPFTSVSELPSSLAPAHLARSIKFDLCVAQASLLLDIASHSLVAFHLSSSPLLFAVLTSISSLAAGTHPALQSLAICILQRLRQGSPNTGAVFGGLGMLTSLGNILAPLVFGIVYSTTVGRFPEAVFGLAAALVLVALGATSLIRTETRHISKGKAPAAAAAVRRRILIAERERGRSRTIKHIGDQVRKPARTSARAANDVSTGTSESVTCSTLAVQSDEAV